MSFSFLSHEDHLLLSQSVSNLRSRYIAYYDLHIMTKLYHEAGALYKLFWALRGKAARYKHSHHRDNDGHHTL